MAPRELLVFSRLRTMKRHSPTVFSSALGPLWVSLGSVLFVGCSTLAVGDTDPEALNPFAPDSSTPGADNTDVGPACIDQARRSCSLDESGVHVSFPKGQPAGNCRYGEQICSHGEWQACTGLVAPKTKDLCNIPGDDSDCNGTPNQGCDCVDTQAARPCGVSDIGSCKLGQQSCENGSWGKCEGEVAPQRERCDNQGIDEDCDGKIDLADDDCSCVDGEEKLCTLNKKGDCNFGVMSCSSGAWGECIPRFPQLERESCEAPRSDAHGSALGDEDCDGEVDNTPRNGKDPTGCTTYIIDEDKDGWGAIGFDYALNLDSYTYGCFCVGHVPNPSMVQGAPDRVDRDCGDCSEGGDLVVPDSTASYAEPSACLKEVEWMGGGFDYNCNNSEELEHPSLGECVEKSGLCVETHGTWVHAVPACGEMGRVAEKCANATPPCEMAPAFGTRYQACN